ncbi:hypothetical protein HYX13_03415 [Candidatus Woesearchaeota archaeon]|nr:hypothetical protein [Candidatus Woesearchaeota archaeon]
MAQEKPNLFHFLQRYYESVSDLGMSPYLVLDTSAVIDLEQAFQKRYGLLRSHLFLEELSHTARGMEFIVTEPIKQELVAHHECIRGGRPEISVTTFEKLQRYSSCPTALQDFRRKQEERIDTVRYTARRSHYALFVGKKAEQDPISSEDWSVIDFGVMLGIFGEYQFEQNAATGKRRFTNCPKGIVLSSDAHVLLTLEKLFDFPEGVGLAQYIKPLNVRNYDLHKSEGKK